MASESQLQAGIQAILQGLDSIQPSSVVINDWGVLDAPISSAPFVVIITSDEFDARQDTMTATTGYTVPLYLIVPLADTDWKDAYDLLRDVRQDIVDIFNTGDNRSADGLDGVDIRRIHSMSSIGFIYPKGVDPEMQPDSLPDYLTQYIGIDVEQF